MEAMKRVRRRHTTTTTTRPIRKFKVIYADCPWLYDDTCDAGTRGVQYLHDCMTDRELLDLGPLVMKLAAPDCVLFHWVTWPRLEFGLDVMGAWGFRYKTLGFNWVKIAREHSHEAPRPVWGMGTWTRSGSEVCLVGVRGRPRRRSKGVHSSLWTEQPDLVDVDALLDRKWDDLVEAPRGRDKSEKPTDVRDRIRALTYGPRLELFARGPTPLGWWAHGKEAEGPRLVTL